MTWHHSLRSYKLLLALSLLWASTVGSGAAPRLDDYPAAGRLWLCYVNGAMAPTREQAYQAEGDGWLRVIADNGSQLRKEGLLAVFRPERLDLDKQTLDLESRMLTYRIEDARLNNLDTVNNYRSQQAEALAQLQELESAMQIPEVINNDGLRKQLNEAVADVRKKLEHLNFRLDIESKGVKPEGDIEQLKLDQRKRELDFENSKRRAELRAPFPGYFTLAKPLVAEQGERQPPFETWVRSGDLIGHVTDNSSYEFSISRYPAILNQAKHQELVVEIQMRAGVAPINATFLEARGAASGRVASEQRTLVFRIDPKQRKSAEAISGSIALAQIFQQLPAGCRLIPKTELTRLLLQAKSSSGDWATLVQSLWPHAELVAIGHRDLAVRNRPADALSN